MAEAFIGSYIRQRREDLGLSQERLCEGICSATTLSRLECGSQTPSRNVVNALLQRLGLPPDRYLSLLSKNETDIQNLKNEIDAVSILHQNAVEPEKTQLQNQLLHMIGELEQIGDDKFVRQYCLRNRARTGKGNGVYYTPEDRIDMLIEAIQVTVPRFDLKHIDESLLVLDEIKILNQVTGAYTSLGRYEDEIEIYRQLMEYIPNHFQDILNGQGHLPMIASNYARALNLSGRNEEAVEMGELGRKACIKYKNYLLLPRLLHTMALAHHDLGNHEKSKQLYQQAYHICNAIEDYRNLALLAEDAREQYGIEFEN